MQLERGSIVTGRYRLERPLAQGAMGCVWVAHHLQLDVDVAIKMMAPGFAESDEARVRFEREAKASALLKIPNAVHVFDYGIESGSPFLVMELLEGEDLAARLRRQGRLSLAATLAVLEPIGKALRRARELGLVHRDLKPGNIFLSRSGDEEIVKVVDFGIAKAAASLGLDAHATRTGALLGSPRYMSPEQVRRSNHIDHRSDLWALGVIAFECTTGQVPFPSDEIGEVLVDVCTAPIPRASSIAPDLGPDVDLFFDHALMRDPDKRFQSAQELVDAFAALVHAGAPAPQASPSFASLPAAPPPPSALPAPAAASHSVSASTTPTASSGLHALPPAIGTLSPSASTHGHTASASRGGTALLAVLSALGGAAVLGAILFVFASRGPSATPPSTQPTLSAEAAALPTAVASPPAAPSPISSAAAPAPTPSAEASPSTAAPSAKPRTGPTARPTPPAHLRKRRMTSSITCDAARRRRALASAALTAAAWLTGSTALAQTAAPKRQDPVAAQALFKAARQLVDKGNYAEGCPQFAASFELYPSASTMLNVAQCHEHDGKLASAWEAYNQALTLNHETKGEERRKGLEDLAKKGIAALEPRLPKLLITIKDPPKGLQVLRDGKELPVAALSTALPADPGLHKIEASAPGYRDETRTVTLEPSKTATVEITLQPAPGSKRHLGLAQQSAGLALDRRSGRRRPLGSGRLLPRRRPRRDRRAPRQLPRRARRHLLPPSYDHRADNARKNRDLPLFIGLGSAGVLALGAAIYGLATAKKPDAEQPKTTALPWVVPGGAGALVGGRF